MVSSSSSRAELVREFGVVQTGMGSKGVEVVLRLSRRAVLCAQKSSSGSSGSSIYVRSL